MAANIPDPFEPIEVQDPTDLIIQQIKDLISSGALKPGQRLPSEPKMEKSFRVSRSVVRSALKKLDAYGIVRVVPHSGTYVTGLGIEALGGLLTNVLELDKKDYQSLVEIRLLLESHAVRITAATATPAQINELDNLHNNYVSQVKKGNISLNEDLIFHIKVSEITGNQILKTLVTLLTSEALKSLGQMEERLGKDAIVKRLENGVLEHEKILKAIKEHKPEEAVKALENHYREAKKFREQAG